ncbi:internalin [Acinetobacter sp. GXMZU3951]
MNKKLLICGALAMGLFLTACVKKEEPKDDEQQVETNQAASEPAQFQPLEASQAEEEVVIPAQVEVERQQTANTTTEIRREETPKPATQVTEAPKVEEKPAPSAQQPTKPNSTAQSEDDAVAAAIAAATPALDNK